MLGPASTCVIRNYTFTRSGDHLPGGHNVFKVEAIVLFLPQQSYTTNLIIISVFSTEIGGIYLKRSNEKVWLTGARYRSIIEVPVDFYYFSRR